MRYLLEHEIEGRINYPTPIHQMRGYAFLNVDHGRLPKTERLAGEILSLPMYPGLASDAVELVIHCIKDFFDRGPGV